MMEDEKKKARAAFFGQMLKMVREGLGFTIKKFAEITGIDKGHISRLERGERNPPKPDTLLKISEEIKFDHEVLMIAAGYITHKENGEEYTQEKIIILVASEIALTKIKTGKIGPKQIAEEPNIMFWVIIGILRSQEDSKRDHENYKSSVEKELGRLRLRISKLEEDFPPRSFEVDGGKRLL